MLKKFFITIAILLAVIVIGSTVLIKLYVTPENIKGFIVSTAEDALKRKVDIGEVNISILKGIEARDFSIKESDGKTDFLKCREFILKYQLMPLLSRQVLIDEITMRSPVVRVVRAINGSFNFDSIGKAEKASAIEREPAVEEAGGLPISLLVNRITFENVKFSVTDMKKEIPDMKGSLDLKTSIMSSGGGEIITEGSLYIKLDELKTDKTVKGISASFDYDAALDLEAGDLTINKADAKIQNIPVSVKGSIKNFKKSPYIDIALLVPKVKAEDIQKIAEPFTEIKGFKLAGEVAADIKLSGRVKETGGLAAEGVMKMIALSIATNGVNAVLDGNVKFDKEILNIDIRGKSGKNTADLKGTVKDYSGKPDIKMNVYSNKLYLDEIVPAGQAGADSQAKNGKAAAETEEAKPLDLKLTANGNVKVDSAVYKGIEMTNFNMKYGFKDNKLDIERMSAEAGRGRLDVVSTIDMSKPGYTYNVSSSLDSLHADEVVNAFFPKAKDTIYGILSFNMNMNGAGTLPENIKKNLVANVDFNIKDGRITDNPLADEFALFLGVDDMKTIDINKAEGTVDIRNGNAYLTSIFSSDDISMNPKGNIGLDETLNLAFDLSLSPELTDKASRNSGIAQYIKNDKDWGEIPILIAGTFSKPSYNVDIAKAGKRVIQKKAIDLIDDLLNKNRKADTPPTDGTVQDNNTRPDYQKPLENLIKGIFN